MNFNSIVLSVACCHFVGIEQIFMFLFDLFLRRRRALAAWQVYRAAFSACECFMD